MKNGLTLIAIFVALVLVAGCIGSSAPSGKITYNNTTTTQQNPAVKFQDTPYYSYAYLISGDTLSADAQQALDGFQMTKKPLSDGYTKIDLIATQNSYIDQSYILKPGQSLYFIETSWGEDGPNYDGSYRDDSAVIVDSNGYVVQPLV